LVVAELAVDSVTQHAFNRFTCRPLIPSKRLASWTVR
jgi:hypothetical protein